MCSKVPKSENFSTLKYFFWTRKADLQVFSWVINSENQLFFSHNISEIQIWLEFFYFVRNFFYSYLDIQCLRLKSVFMQIQNRNKNKNVLSTFCTIKIGTFIGLFEQKKATIFILCRFKKVIRKNSSGFCVLRSEGH